MWGGIADQGGSEVGVGWGRTGCTGCFAHLDRSTKGSHPCSAANHCSPLLALPNHAPSTSPPPRSVIDFARFPDFFHLLALPNHAPSTSPPPRSVIDFARFGDFFLYLALPNHAPSTSPLPCSVIDFARFRDFFLLLPANGLLVDYWLASGRCEGGGGASLYLVLN